MRWLPRRAVSTRDPNGVPIIATQTLDLAWDWVEAASAAQVRSGAVPEGRGVRREDQDTWDDERWPRGVEGGILPYLGGTLSSGAMMTCSHPW